MSTPSDERVSGQEGVSMPIGGFGKEIDVELYGTTRATSPGGLVVVRYCVNSYQDTDERVRLRVHLPEGWILLDSDAQGREVLLEAWESVEGEIRLAAAKEARPGQRHLVRMRAEVAGEPGGADVFSTVQIVRRGGLRPGAVGLTGTSSVLATSFAVDDLSGARYGGFVDLSGKLTRQATLSLTYRQGPRESTLTNYRIAQEETRWSGTLRTEGWTLQVGNQIATMGTSLTGPYVRGRGLSARRTEGRLIGDLTVAEPTTFSGQAGGYLVRGSVGMRGRSGRAALVFSDFSRPGGYSTLPRYPENIDPEEMERLERERRAFEKAARNRVLGGGVEAEFQHGTLHRLLARGGWLHLENTVGDEVAAPSTELQYGLNSSRVSITTRWRHMPDALQGVGLMGSERSLDASLKVVEGWSVTGRRYNSLNRTRGSDYQSAGEGSSAGVRYMWQAWRAEVRGSERTWSYGGPTTRARTLVVSLGAPLGPLVLSAYGERGVQRRDTLRQPSATYLTNLRWSSKGGSSISGSASYYEALGTLPRLRADVLVSFKWEDWELSGGGWATRGLVRGGEPGFWTQVGVPLSYDLGITLGLEYAPPAWGQPPAWLGSIGVRKKMAFALPFLHSPAAQPLPADPSTR